MKLRQKTQHFKNVENCLIFYFPIFNLKFIKGQFISVSVSTKSVFAIDTEFHLHYIPDYKKHPTTMIELFENNELVNFLSEEIDDNDSFWAIRRTDSALIHAVSTDKNGFIWETVQNLKLKALSHGKLGIFGIDKDNRDNLFSAKLSLRILILSEMVN